MGNPRRQKHSAQKQIPATPPIKPSQVPSYKTFSGDTEQINPGTLVAVNLQNYEEWPQIGKVINSNEDTVTLAWYDGTYSSPWIKVKLKKGKQYIEWREIVCRDVLIMYDITLTSGYRLRKDAVEKLKSFSHTSG